MRMLYYIRDIIEILMEIVSISALQSSWLFKVGNIDIKILIFKDFEDRLFFKKFMCNTGNENFSQMMGNNTFDKFFSLNIFEVIFNQLGKPGVRIYA